MTTPQNHSTGDSTGSPVDGRVDTAANPSLRLTVSGTYRSDDTARDRMAMFTGGKNPEALAALVARFEGPVQVDLADADRAVTPDDLLAMYSSAIDEIYRLRRALAYEAGAIETDLTYATYPKSRRALAEQRIERMRAAACGQVATAYRDRSNEVLRHAMRDAGAPETLTNPQWETQSGFRNADGTRRTAAAGE